VGEVRALDCAASRFRTSSELLGLQSAAPRAVAISETLFRALEEALAAAEETDGVLDPTVGEALVLCGYDRDFSEVSPTGPPLTARLERVPGWRGIRLDRGSRTASVPAGVQIDLGATAKAGCADRCAQEAADWLGCGVLVNMGGDIAVAGEAPEGGWVVRVADRHDAGPGEAAVTVAITSGGLATSGTAARRWWRGGELLHHVIDPATGRSARRFWRTVTVAAPSCLVANTASTAAVILGPAAPGWLATRRFHARLVAEDGSVTGVGDWPLDALVPRSPQPDREGIGC
ncbi:MAG TPA: FAD:protein FMN transferase, partial [Acidimicrobiales bacterium]|nr:FAD:protein FMN transferase [Acidimicrobiales bacterium]